ncbi:DUF1269 domain-containing protein [Natronosporangium hydrolyticum]|uniref:DUF1269 domain-containing protein n=1 Tax=Natronosporangium hydrolyticum TaxID=2811111 RepID=A0A895YJ32_9ACTN|nr:DUF1269 domain-containing protein [Natronosporangium hydrolyticum]QSB15373.1 DUF1269 domain-containing protein [Natronosporangium hydrolyticum]
MAESALVALLRGRQDSPSVAVAQRFPHHPAITRRGGITSRYQGEVCDMAHNDEVFLYLGVYDDPAVAEEAYEAVKQLHQEGIIGSYDAAEVIRHDHSVKVHKREKPTQHGAWTGLVAGGVIGLLFPPALIGGAALAAGGAVAGGVIGHLWRGLSRSDLKELGEELDQGQAALIVVAKDRIDEQIDKAYRRARRSARKQLHVDLDQMQREVENAFAESTR